MSRSVVRYRALLVLALVALAVGTTTSAAFGWANEEGSGSEQEQSHQGGKKEHGNEEHGNKENKGENHNKGNHGENQKPEEETPATPQPQPQPQPTPVPPVATPVAPQGTPAQTPEQQPSTPPATEETPKSTEVAQSPTVGQPSVSATPAANREQLASTGIDPALIALFGALFVGGGALLFRRSLAGGRE